MKAIHRILLGSMTCLLASGCSGNSNSLEPEPQEPEATSTWDIIQTVILDKNCVECHVAGASFATQSDLVLTSNVAYSQLVNRTPKNPTARDDGLTLVGTEGLASVDKSFLWEKINAPNQAHYFDDHPGYGALMPLGKPPLTNGELEFVLQWILAGAPSSGNVVDTDVLDNTERYEPPEFEPLPVPTSGIQFHLGPWDVAPNFEREFFYYEPLNNDQPLFVNRVDMAMRPGSHHLILYDLSDNIPEILVPEPQVFREIRDTNGNYIPSTLMITSHLNFVTGTQWPRMTYHYPPGVAMRIPADAGFDINAHYVNRSSQIIQGEIYANLHTVDSSQVEHVAERLFMNNLDINLPPNAITTLNKTFVVDKKVQIFQLFSHAHEHMTEFRVFIDGGPRDGELVYIAYDWEHPPILELNPTLTLEAGQGLRLQATYNNDTNSSINFGFLSSDEMMILFGAYYVD
jgi:hypothetical protein|tara:strand:+ start:268 stop:1644 length:1377 start_codon:yes stop_codon:yes gene_type:complete